MGTFQVVYDDFSGGQYMGARPANQPKNTWNGTNVIASPNGELIPTGTRTLGTWDDGGSAGLIDAHFYENVNGYFFTDAPRMVRYTHNNGLTTPISFTTYTPSISGVLVSVAFSELHDRFYALAASGTGGNLYHITKTGTATLFHAFGASTFPQGTAIYKQRVIVWARSKLYYSGVWSGSAYGAFNLSTQFYDFDSDIIAIFPRTDDLLVVCEDGTFSLTGVLGSGVTIQTLTPGANVSAGMRNGAIVNRSLFYLDEFNSNGSIDGRLYRMIGASIQAVASFEYGDYDFADNGFNIADPGRVVALPNGRMAAQFRSGVTYFESAPGVFAKSDVFDTLNTGTARSSTGRYRLAEQMPGAPDEYILTAVIAASSGSELDVTIYRTMANVPGPTKLDANFNYSTNSTCIVNPSGTVKLSEYWHNKPFTVKEAFIEYSITTGGSVSCTIIPTGVVDVPAANLASVVSTAASETSPPAGDYRMYRYWPNNAAKGFGVIPELTITNCFVKRVILNCED